MQMQCHMDSGFADCGQRAHCPTDGRHGCLDGTFAIYRRFLNFGSIDTLEWIILCCGCLSCVLLRVEQHLWPLPTRMPIVLPPPLWHPKMSPDIAKCPGRGGGQPSFPPVLDTLRTTVLSDWVLKLSKGWSYLVTFVNQLEVGPGLVPKINSNLFWENNVFA